MKKYNRKIFSFIITATDVVAPSLNILSCDNTQKGYVKKSGTSMATPIVSGAIALLLSEYPELTNKEVKMRLMMNSVDLGLNWERQGWGMINAYKLIYGNQELIL